MLWGRRGYAVVLAVALGSWSGAQASDADADTDAYPEVDAVAGELGADVGEDAVSPWSRGLTPKQREQAASLLAEGNEYFLASEHPEALTKYLEALAHWDHPAIAFNAARALIRLDRPVEAFAYLERALAYGPGPLQAQVFVEAQNYRRLLRGQIAEISVECTQPGVRVSIDGKEFLTCPGSRSKHVAAGHHQILGEKQGFLAENQTVLTLPGKRKATRIELTPILEPSAPWYRSWWFWTIAATVVAAGAATTAIVFGTNGSPVGSLQIDAAIPSRGGLR